MKSQGFSACSLHPDAVTLSYHYSARDHRYLTFNRAVSIAKSTTKSVDFLTVDEALVCF